MLSVTGRIADDMKSVAVDAVSEYFLPTVIAYFS